MKMKRCKQVIAVVMAMVLVFTATPIRVEASSDDDFFGILGNLGETVGGTIRQGAVDLWGGLGGAGYDLVESLTNFRPFINFLNRAGAGENPNRAALSEWGKAHVSSSNNVVTAVFNGNIIVGIFKGIVSLFTGGRSSSHDAPPPPSQAALALQAYYDAKHEEKMRQWMENQRLAFDERAEQERLARLEAEERNRILQEQREAAYQVIEHELSIVLAGFVQRVHEWQTQQRFAAYSFLLSDDTPPNAEHLNYNDIMRLLEVSPIPMDVPRPAAWDAYAQIYYDFVEAGRWKNSPVDRAVLISADMVDFNGDGNPNLVLLTAASPGSNQMTVRVYEIRNQTVRPLNRQGSHSSWTWNVGAHLNRIYITQGADGLPAIMALTTLPSLWHMEWDGGGLASYHKLHIVGYAESTTANFRRNSDGVLQIAGDEVADASELVNLIRQGARSIAPWGFALPVPVAVLSADMRREMREMYDNPAALLSEEYIDAMEELGVLIGLTMHMASDEVRAALYELMAEPPIAEAFWPNTHEELIQDIALLADWLTPPQGWWETEIDFSFDAVPLESSDMTYMGGAFTIAAGTTLTVASPPEGFDMRDVTMEIWHFPDGWENEESAAAVSTLFTFLAIEDLRPDPENPWQEGSPSASYLFNTPGYYLVLGRDINWNVGDIGNFFYGFIHVLS